MTRRPSSKAQLLLLGEVLQMLRQRRHRLHGLVIHADGTIEIHLTPPSIDAQEAALDAELAELRRLHGYE